MPICPNWPAERRRKRAASLLLLASSRRDTTGALYDAFASLDSTADNALAELASTLDSAAHGSGGAFTHTLADLADALRNPTADFASALATPLPASVAECLAIRIDRKLKAVDVIDVLSDLFILRGVPGHIRSVNGPEFVAKAVQEWIAAVGAEAPT